MRNLIFIDGARHGITAVEDVVAKGAGMSLFHQLSDEDDAFALHTANDKHVHENQFFAFAASRGIDGA